MTLTPPTDDLPPTEPAPAPANLPARPEGDGRFFLIVGALMLTIIALLSGLWLRTHLRNAQLEAEVVAARSRRAKLEDFLKAYLLQNPPPEIIRGELATRPAVLDGKDITLLRLNAELAAKVGLRPGDVLTVDPPAASAPASMSAAGRHE